MDRSKWEYKKLGEVATFERGLTYSKGDEATISSNCVLRSNNIDLDTHELVFDEIKYLDPNFVIPESKKLKKDSIFICMSNGSKAHLGKVAFADKDYDYAFGGFMGMIIPKDIYPRYLFYYFLSHNYRNGLEQVGKGANINNLRFAQLAEFKVPTPLIDVQQRIVAELDCLNEMIAVKREQLKEFDKLAQSIFYDMFGDPIKNERSWKTDIIGNVVSEKSYRGPIANTDGKVWLLNLDMVESNTGRIIDKLMVPNEKTDGSVTTFNEEYVLYSKLRPYLNKVVMPDTSGYCTTELVTLLPNKTILNRYYLTFLLRSDSFVNYICGKVAGAKMPRVSMKDFRILTIPLPPLSLQQQFAEKISAVEAQKELVKQSIAETQHLLDYTMDKYFG